MEKWWFNSIDKGKIIFIFWVCWFSWLEIYFHINYSYLDINDYSENSLTYWETWYAQKGFRRLIIILPILIATFLHFFLINIFAILFLFLFSGFFLLHYWSLFFAASLSPRDISRITYLICWELEVCGKCYLLLGS